MISAAFYTPGEVSVADMSGKRRGAKKEGRERKRKEGGIVGGNIQKGNNKRKT